MSFVLKSTEERARLWRPMFASELPELAFHVWPEPEIRRRFAIWPRGSHRKIWQRFFPILKCSFLLVQVWINWMIFGLTQMFLRAYSGREGRCLI